MSKMICACVYDTPQVFDGAVIVLSLAPMVASTVANGPSSPWDAISLIITLRIWRVKRIIDGEAGKSLVSVKVVLLSGLFVRPINRVSGKYPIFLNSKGLHRCIKMSLP